MTEAEAVLQIVGTIYDAALDRALWVRALKMTYEFVGGGACALYSKDAASGTGSAFFNVGIPLAFEKSYFETYVRLDPTTTALMFCNTGDVVGTADLVPYSEILASRFYREWLRPQQILDSVRAIVEKSSTSYGVVSVFRYDNHGLADSEARRRMRLLAPHFRRAVLIGNVMNLQRASIATLTDLLSEVSAGVLLVDSVFRVIFANPAGQSMLEEGKVLCKTNGILATVDTAALAVLREACTASIDGDAAVGIKGIAVPLTAGDERWIAHVLPLKSGTRQLADVNPDAVAAVFIRKAGLNLSMPMEIVAGLYKLTPAEIRVLHAIAEIGGIADTAEALGISEPTVKTHLQRLFEKTGTSRQADLVRLLAAHISPLSG